MVKKLLAKSAFWVVNKNIAKAVGSNDAALLLSELLDLHLQHPNDEMVFCQQSRLMENCNLSITGLRNSMKILFDLNLVYIEKRGVPAKNYYKVLENNVEHLLSGSLSTSDQPITSDTVSYITSDQDSLEQINKHNINKPSINKSLDRNNIIDIPDSMLNKEDLRLKAEMVFQ